MGVKTWRELVWLVPSRSLLKGRELRAGVGGEGRLQCSWGRGSVEGKVLDAGGGSLRFEIPGVVGNAHRCWGSHQAKGSGRTPRQLR